MKKCWRKIGQMVRLILVFLSGLLLVYGMEVWAQWDGLTGGKVLILPLIVLLIYLGWQLGFAVGKEVHANQCITAGGSLTVIFRV